MVKVSPFVDEMVPIPAEAKPEAYKLCGERWGKLYKELSWAERALEDCGDPTAIIKPLYFASALTAEREARERAERERDLAADRYAGLKEVADYDKARAEKAQATLAQKDAEIARLREALRPFATDASIDGRESIAGLFHVSDLRRAREALKGPSHDA